LATKLASEEAIGITYQLDTTVFADNR
jgi:hypothetical protein